MSEKGWLEKIGLEPGVTYAYRATRRNRKLLDKSTQGAKLDPKNSRYENGVTLQKKEIGWRLRVWTIENNTHCVSCELCLTEAGDFDIGAVNCFSLGWMSASAGYWAELLDELADTHWDEIKKSKAEA
jgi:hypothetical protein